MSAFSRIQPNAWPQLTYSLSRLLKVGLFILAFLVGSWGEKAFTYDRPPRLDELTPQQRELMERIMTLAVPSSEERVMYHYGREEPCNRLISHQTYTGAIYERYSRLREGGGVIAGHGVYMAGNPRSSIEYFLGGAVQVVVERGTPIIDTTDWNVQKRMRELGITDSDIHNLPIDAVVRYSDGLDWYVLKGPTGIRFQAVDFTRMSVQDLGAFLAHIPGNSLLSNSSSRFTQDALQELRRRPHPIDDALREIGNELPASWAILQEFSEADRLQALDFFLESKKISKVFQAGGLSASTPRNVRQMISELAPSALAEVRAHAASGTVSDVDLRRIVYFSGRSTVSEWDISRTVSSLNDTDRERLGAILDQLIDEYSPGRRTGVVPSIDGLKPLGRLFASLQQSRTPAAQVGSESIPSGRTARSIAETTDRYLALLRDQYQVRNPRLPRLSRGPTEASCRSFLSASLNRLRDFGPILTPVGIGMGFSYATAELNRRVNQAKLDHARGLCQSGQGSFEGDPEGGVARCVCPNGSVTRWAQFDDLPRTDQNGALCPSST